MANKQANATRIGRLVVQANDGAKAELKDGLSFSVGGVTYTTAELVAKLASYESLFTTVRDDKLALTGSLQARDQALPEMATFLSELHAALIGVYGEESPELVKFGFKPRKKAAPLTSEQALARATKAKATRAKRGLSEASRRPRSRPRARRSSRRSCPGRSRPRLRPGAPPRPRLLRSRRRVGARLPPRRPRLRSRGSFPRLRRRPRERGTEVSRAG